MIYYISDLHFGHLRCIEMDKRPFSSIEEMDRILIENWNNKVNEDQKRVIYLCHLPFAEWPYYQRNTYHIYGHIHNDRGETFQFMSKKERALNAGCMINHYEPVTLDELIKNNQEYMKRGE